MMRDPPGCEPQVSVPFVLDPCANSVSTRRASSNPALDCRDFTMSADCRWSRQDDNASPEQVHRSARGDDRFDVEGAVRVSPLSVCLMVILAPRHFHDDQDCLSLRLIRYARE